MTIGSESFGNGAAKTEDRFAAQLSNYRQAGRRDSGATLTGDPDPETLSPRNGNSMDRVTTAFDAGSPIGASLTAPKLAEPGLRALDSLSEPVFGRDSWLDTPGGSLADHPLLRGLLLELPPKGTIPQQDWLDRWFEAARSILELLYSQEARS